MGICDSLTVLDYGKVIASTCRCAYASRGHQGLSRTRLHDERLAECKDLKVSYGGINAVKGIDMLIKVSLLP
jgi:ABC-type branched-subunit amino acid transport system ATPase component